MEILVFTLDTHRYGLPAREVDQIARAVAITPLPGAPPVVEGIVDVRGSMIPVLDLRLRFGLAEQAPRLTDLLIIASSRSRRIAIRADANATVQRIDPVSLKRVDEALARSPYVAGLATLPDGIVVIHDLASFLSEAESESLTKALAELKGKRVA